MWQGAVVNAVVDAVKFERNMYEAKRAEQRARDWQREVAQNAHTWEVSDLRKAGLNPILSAGGKGANIPAAMQAQLPQTGGPDITSALQAEQERIRTKYMKGGERIYDGSPVAKAMVDGANMAQQNGLSPTAGGVFGAAVDGIDVEDSSAKAKNTADITNRKQLEGKSGPFINLQGPAIRRPLK